MASTPIRVTVWNENIHDREDPRVQRSTRMGSTALSRPVCGSSWARRSLCAPQPSSNPSMG